MGETPPFSGRELQDPTLLLANFYVTAKNQCQGIQNWLNRANHVYWQTPFYIEKLLRERGKKPWRPLNRLLKTWQTSVFATLTRARQDKEKDRVNLCGKCQKFAEKGEKQMFCHRVNNVTSSPGAYGLWTVLQGFYGVSAKIEKTKPYCLLRHI